MVRSGIIFTGAALVGCATAFAPPQIGSGAWYYETEDSSDSVLSMELWFVELYATAHRLLSVMLCGRTGMIDSTGWVGNNHAFVIIIPIFVLLTHARLDWRHRCYFDTFDIIVSTARSGATSLSMAKALIVQNKGGGHGELGKVLIYFRVE